jgi:hypothetical protein
MTRNGCGLDILAAPRSWYVGRLGHKICYAAMNFLRNFKNESIRNSEKPAGPQGHGWISSVDESQIYASKARFDFHNSPMPCTMMRGVSRSNHSPDYPFEP